ncbi:unnamed protein product [Owenia fusiformis]|uniref:Uncharacterized protein n=1 Tax=Owenia fusiformis TaxID=6347 RepID=A0A8J1TX81_OWEFU|nr:unnamed protein product [Owenia fusiformis]
MSKFEISNIKPNPYRNSDETCKDLACNQNCEMVHGVPQCSCMRGFYLRENGLTCVDVDECQRNHPCEQLCRNTRGSFRCSCQRGYVLNTDRKTCRRVYGIGGQYVYKSENIEKTTSQSPDQQQPQQDDPGQVLVGFGLQFIGDEDQETTTEQTHSTRPADVNNADFNTPKPENSDNNQIRHNSRIEHRFENQNNQYDNTRDTMARRNKYYKAWYPQYNQRAKTYYNQNQGARTYHYQNQGDRTYKSRNEEARTYYSQNQGDWNNRRYDDTATRRIGSQQIDFGLQYSNQGHISRPWVTVNRQPNYRQTYTRYLGRSQYRGSIPFRDNSQFRGNTQYRGDISFRENSRYRHNNQYGSQDRTQPSIQYKSNNQIQYTKQDNDPRMNPNAEIPQQKPVYASKFINAYNMDPSSLPTGAAYQPNDLEGNKGTEQNKNDDEDNKRDDDKEQLYSRNTEDRQQLDIGNNHYGRREQLHSGNTNNDERQQLHISKVKDGDDDNNDQMVKVYRKGHNLNHGKQFTFGLKYVDGSEKISRVGEETGIKPTERDDLNNEDTSNKKNEVDIVAPSVTHKSRVIPGGGVSQQTGINPPDRSRFDAAIYDNQGRDLHPDFSQFDVAIYPNDNRTDEAVRNSLNQAKQERNPAFGNQELANLNQIPTGNFQAGDRIYRGPVFSQTPPRGKPFKNGPFDQPVIRGPVFSQTPPEFPPGQGGVQQPVYRQAQGRRFQMKRPMFDPYSGQAHFSRWIQRNPWQVQEPCSSGCGYNGPCSSGCGSRSQFTNRFMGALYPCGGGSLGPCSENQWENNYPVLTDPTPCSGSGCINDPRPCAVPGGCQDLEMQDSGCPDGNCLNHGAAPCAVPGGCDNLDPFIGPQPCRDGECMNLEPTPCAVPGGCDGLDMMDGAGPCMGGDCGPPCDSGDCLNHEPAPCAVPGGCEQFDFQPSLNCPFGPCQSGALCTARGCQALGPLPCESADCADNHDHSPPCQDPTCDHHNNQHSNQLPWKPKHLGNRKDDESDSNNAKRDESPTSIPNIIPDSSTKDINKGAHTKPDENETPTETQQHEGRKIMCPDGAQLVHTEQGPQCTYLRNEECSPRCQNGGTCQRGKCVCPEGLQGNVCQHDIDECRENKHTCEYRCENTFAGHVCTCPPGMNVTATGACKELSCEPKCRNGGTCSMGKCQCPPGFRGKDCAIDINECDSATGKGLCEHICMNSYGSFTCHCPRGQILNDDQRTCKNQTSCSSECQNGGTCIDTRCQCAAGFYGRQCELDIDECHHFKPCSHTCVNTQGSYKCQCPEGYTLQYNKRRCEPLEDKNNRQRERERQYKQRSRS